MPKHLTPVPNIVVPLGFDFTTEDPGEPIITHVPAGSRQVVFKVRTTAKVKALVEAQGMMFEAMHPPLTVARSYSTSRLVIMLGPDSIPQIVPLLSLLATAKYGPWDPRKDAPIWIDMDWTNESLENVGMTVDPSATLSKPRKPSSYGVPAGTPEYFKRYRQQNADKWKQYQKSYRTRRSEAMQRDRESQAAKRAGRTYEENVTPHTEGLSAKLDDILKDLHDPKTD